MKLTLKEIAEWHAEQARRTRYAGIDRFGYTGKDASVSHLDEIQFHEQSAELLARVSDLTEAVPT